MRTLRFIAALLTAALTGTAHAQEINKPKLDSFFNTIAAKNKGMGSVAVSKNGHVVYTKAIGYSYINGAEKIPANDQTKYRVGSVTKMFTATMIMQLVQEHKVDLAATIDKYFPLIPNANKITVENLLNHRSGIHNFTEDSSIEKWKDTYKTEKEMLAILAADHSDFEPGTQMHYSNSNYLLLGYIIEHVTKKSYAQELKARITSVIGLKNTYVGTNSDIKKNEAFSYTYSDEKWGQVSQTDMSVPGGAGCIVSTPSDLVMFINALFAGKLVTKESLAQMTKLTDGYGYAMIKIPFGLKKAFGHTGSIDEFETMLGYFPTDTLAFAYITNEQDYPMNDIAIGVLSICYNKPYTIPTFEHSTYVVASELMDKYLGRYESKQIPLKIHITRDDKQLFGQATGQPAFPLEPTEKGKFSYETAGIILEFDADKNEMTLKQGGGTYLYTKEK